MAALFSTAWGISPHSDVKKSKAVNGLSASPAKVELKPDRDLKGLAKSSAIWPHGPPRHVDLKYHKVRERSLEAIKGSE